MIQIAYRLGLDKTMATGTTQQHIIVANGIRHRVLIAGSSEAPAVLLLHGLGWDHTLWAAFVEPLVAEGFRIVAPDLRGMGETDKPDGCYSIERYKDDAAAILDELSVDRVTVVGFSLGGMIAAKLALTDSRVAGLVLACCSLHSEPAAERATDAMLAQAEGEGALVFAQAQARAIWSHDWACLHPDLVAGFIQRRAAMDQASLHRAFRASYGVDLRKGCALLRVPTLVVAADHDPFVSLAAARAVADTIPGAAFQVISSGHMVPLEQPDAFLAAIKDLLCR